MVGSKRIIFWIGESSLWKSLKMTSDHILLLDGHTSHVLNLQGSQGTCGLLPFSHHPLSTSRQVPLQFSIILRSAKKPQKHSTFPWSFHFCYGWTLAWKWVFCTYTSFIHEAQGLLAGECETLSFTDSSNVDWLLRRFWLHPWKHVTTILWGPGHEPLVLLVWGRSLLGYSLAWLFGSLPCSKKKGVNLSTLTTRYSVSIYLCQHHCY